MLCPTVVTAAIINRDSPSWQALTFLVPTAMVLFVRALFVDNEIEGLKELRNNVGKITLVRQDNDNAVKKINRKIVNSVTTSDDPITVPYLITASTTITWSLVTAADPRVQTSLIFFLGLVATILVAYQASKLGKAQTTVRSELQELLPYVDYSTESSQLPAPLVTSNEEELKTPTYVRVDEEIPLDKNENNPENAVLPAQAATTTK